MLFFRLCQLKCSYVAALYVPHSPPHLLSFVVVVVVVYDSVRIWDRVAPIVG